MVVVRRGRGGGRGVPRKRQAATNAVRGGGGRGRGRRGAGPFRLKSTLCAHGGRCGRSSLPIQATEVGLPGATPDTFVKIEASAAWLTKAVTGKTQSKRKEGLNRLCPMMCEIRKALEQGLSTDRQAVNDAADIDESDPMSGMDIVSIAPSQAGVINKKKSWSTEQHRRQTIKELTNQVLEVQVPERTTLELSLIHI